MNSELKLLCNSYFALVSLSKPSTSLSLSSSALSPTEELAISGLYVARRGISERMNRWGFEQNAMAACQEMKMESVVCPKPRRLNLQTPEVNDPIRAHRWPISHAKTGNSKTGAELLDMILTKESYGETYSHQLGTSPPFFWGGSPPSRASNPLVQDEQFGNGNNIYQLCEGPPSPSPSSSRKGGGCARMKFGHRPAAVRIEGFDCLNRGAQNCSISAVA